MTLLETIRTFEAVAGRQPSVKTIVRNDIFRLNTLPDVRYGVFAWMQREHTITADLHTYSFVFYYVDRLTADKGNEIEVQSVGIQTLGNILASLEALGVYPEADWTAPVFNPRFLDECAGVFASVRLQVPADWVCPESWPDFNDSEFNDDFNIV